MKTQLYPLGFKPIYKETIWGGRDLGIVLNRELPPGRIGESWEIAAHPHGMSIVQNGPLAGRTLEDLVLFYQEDLLGKRGMNDQNKFPFLLKFIHAKQDLSVQVHPDDAYIRDHGTDAWGKTELWYIVDAEPGAWIVWGLKPGITKEKFTQAISKGAGAIIDCLNQVAVKPGEIYPISAGLVHALGAGVGVVEIQQNSDTTYRVYDWNRLDSMGQPRELHVDKALDVIDFSAHALDPLYQLGRCEKHFVLNVLSKPDSFNVELEQGFQLITILNEQAEISYNDQFMSLSMGESYLIPAALERFSISSKGIVLQCTLPNLEASDMMKNHKLIGND